jgi:AraC family transcriptional regulator, transcriptional activator of pobA
MIDKQHIPIYSLHNFSAPERKSQQFQAEVFDANRHFQVKYPHRHDFFEVLYLAKGSGFHVIDDNKYRIEPPCVFFLSPGQAHMLELSDDVAGYIFLFTSEFYLLNRSNRNRLIEFPFFFTVQQNNPPLFLTNHDDDVFVKSLFKKAVEETNRHANLELLRSLLDVILNECAALYPGDQGLLTGKGHLLVKKFYQLVEENFMKNLAVNEYAAQLAVTPNHLTQTIKQLTGKTSVDFIKAKQVLEIKRLLVHTNLGITEIATLLNFHDQSYFTKFFKKETGKTPLTYRKETMK